MQIEITLTQEDKTKLIKQANSKQLSLSTYCSIIADIYILETTKDKELNEKYKGTLRTHLVLSKNKSQIKDSKKIKTALLQFLHAKEDKDLNKYNWKMLDRQVQSKCDKTHDPNYLKNMIIRNTYKKEN